MKEIKIPSGQSFIAVSDKEAALLYFPTSGGMVETKKIGLTEFGTVEELFNRLMLEVFEHSVDFKYCDLEEEDVMLVPLDKHGFEGDYSVALRTDERGDIDISVYSTNVLEKTKTRSIKKEDRELDDPEIELGM